MDNGNPVTILEEGWRSIPLVPNKEKVDTKLTPRVYPIGVKDPQAD